MFAECLAQAANALDTLIEDGLAKYFDDHEMTAQERAQMRADFVKWRAEKMAEIGADLRRMLN
jgi:hypothetical protein